MDFRSSGPGLTVMHFNCRCMCISDARHGTQRRYMVSMAHRDRGNLLPKRSTHLLQVIAAHSNACSGPLCLLLRSVKLRGHSGRPSRHCSQLAITVSTRIECVPCAEAHKCAPTQPSLIFGCARAPIRQASLYVIHAYAHSSSQLLLSRSSASRNSLRTAAPFHRTSTGMSTQQQTQVQVTTFSKLSKLEGLEVIKGDVPEPKEGEVLCQIYLRPVNPTDVHAIQGLRPIGPHHTPHIAGCEGKAHAV